MSWIITGTEKSPVDPYRSQVSLLLHGDGTNGSTTIVDSSPSPKTVTAVGNAQISTAQSKFGGASIAFDGSGDYLTVNVGSDTGFGTSDFTIEWHMYYTGSTTAFGGHILDLRGTNNGAHVYYVNNGTIHWVNDNTVGDINTGVSVDSSVWTYWSFVRQSTTYRLYKNGVQVYSVANSDNIPSNSPIYVANRFTNSGQLPGYIDDLRITKGVARYTSNFTPPTQPFPDI